MELRGELVAEENLRAHKSKEPKQVIGLFYGRDRAE